MRDAKRALHPRHARGAAWRRARRSSCSTAAAGRTSSPAGRAGAPGCARTATSRSSCTAAAGPLACHHCGHRERVPSRCDDVRLGVDRAPRRRDRAPRARARERRRRCCRLDADVARTRRGAARASRRADAGDARRHADGRQGPRLPRRRRSASWSTPTRTLRFPDFRAEERTFALVAQLAGRGGPRRGGRPGARADARARAPRRSATPRATTPTASSRGELERREALRYPPFSTLDPGRLLQRASPAPRTPPRPPRSARAAARRRSARRRCSACAAASAARSSSRPHDRARGDRARRRRGGRGRGREGAPGGVVQRRRRPAVDRASADTLTADGRRARASSPSRSPRTPSTSSRRLDPEVLARARGGAPARAQVRRSGAAHEGARRSSASTTSCATRSRRMGGLMNDAIGIGLAATAGRRRAPPARLPRRARQPRQRARQPGDRVVPQGRGVARGGLPEPARASTSTSSGPIHVRVRAQDEHGERDRDRGVRPGGARHPARDRPPRRRPDPRPHAARPAQGGDARAARARGGARRPPREDRLPRHVGLRRRRARAPGARARTAPRSSSPGPTARRAAAAGCRRRRSPRPRASSASSSTSPSTSTPSGAGARSPPRSPTSSSVCAFGALIKEPLLSDHEMLNVHPSLLPRWRGAAPVERAIMAGDDETGVSIMRVTAGLDSGPVCLAGGRADPARRHLRHARRRGWRTLGADLLLRALDERAAVRRAARGGRDVRREDRAGRPHARPGGARRPSTSASSARCTRTSARGWRSPTASFLGVRAARAGDDGTLELLEVQPPGGRPMASADYLRGHPGR